MVEEWAIYTVGYGIVNWGDGYGVERDQAFGLSCRFVDEFRVKPDRPGRGVTPMARQVITIPAGEHERFAARSWDSQIGKEVPVNLRETDDAPVIAQVGHVRVIAAEVSEDGSSVTLTLEVDYPEDLTASRSATALSP